MSLILKPFGDMFNELDVKCITLKKLYYDSMKMNVLEVEIEEVINSNFINETNDMELRITNFNMFESIYSVVSFIYSILPYIDESIILKGNVLSHINKLQLTDTSGKKVINEFSKNSFMIISPEDFLDSVLKQTENDPIMKQYKLTTVTDITKFIHNFIKEQRELYKLNRISLAKRLNVSMPDNSSERIILLQNYCMSMIDHIYQVFYSIIVNTFSTFSYIYDSELVHGPGNQVKDYMLANKISFKNDSFYNNILVIIDETLKSTNFFKFLEYMKSSFNNFYSNQRILITEYESIFKLFKKDEHETGTRDSNSRIEFSGATLSREPDHPRLEETNLNYINAQNIISKVNSLLLTERTNISDSLVIHRPSFQNKEGFTIEDIENSIEKYNNSTFYLFYIESNSSDKIISICLIEEQNSLTYSEFEDIPDETLTEEKLQEKNNYIHKVFTHPFFRNKGYGKNILYAIMYENPTLNFVAPIIMSTNWKQCFKFLFYFDFIPNVITYDETLKEYIVELKSYYKFESECKNIRKKPMFKKISHVRRNFDENMFNIKHSEFNTYILRFIEFMNQGKVESGMGDKLDNTLSIFHYLDNPYTEHLVESLLHNLNRMSLIQDFYCKLNFNCFSEFNSKSKDSTYTDGILTTSGSYGGLEFPSIKRFFGNLYKLLASVSTNLITNYICLYNIEYNNQGVMTEKNLFCIFKPTFFIYNTIVHTIRDFCITNIGETRILSLADSNNLNNFNIYIPSSGKDEAEFNMLILAIIDAFQSLVLFFEVSKENNIPCMDNTDYTFIKISYKKEQNIKSININSNEEEFINKVKKVRYDILSESLQECNYTILFSPSELLEIKNKYINQQVEYGGVWNIKKVSVKKGKKEVNKYFLTNRKDFKGEKTSIVIPDKKFVAYHTHPYTTYRDFLTFNTPSSTDLVSSIMNIKLFNQILNLVITVEGVYYIELSNDFKYYLKLLSDDCLRFVNEFIQKKFKKELEPYNLLTENLDIITFLKKETVAKINMLRKIYFGKLPINKTTQDIANDFIEQFIDNMNNITVKDFPTILDQLYKVRDLNQFYNICNMDSTVKIFNVSFMRWNDISEAEKNNEILSYNVNTVYDPENEVCPFYDIEDIVRTFVNVRTSSMYLNKASQKNPREQLDILLTETLEQRILSDIDMNTLDIGRSLSIATLESNIESQEDQPSSPLRKRKALPTPTSTPSKLSKKDAQKQIKKRLEDTSDVVIDNILDMSSMYNINPNYIADSLKDIQNTTLLEDEEYDEKSFFELRENNLKAMSETIKQNQSILESKEKEVSYIKKENSQKGFSINLEDIDSTQEYDI